MAGKKREWTPEDDAAIRSYPSKSLGRLAIELKAGGHVIKRRLIELGIPIRKPGRPGRALPERKESDFGSDQVYYEPDGPTV